MVGQARRDSPCEIVMGLNLIEVAVQHETRKSKGSWKHQTPDKWRWGSKDYWEGRYQSGGNRCGVTRQQTHARGPEPSQHGVRSVFGAITQYRVLCGK